MTDSKIPNGPTRTCVNCDKLAVSEYKPFCSRHCADVDLGRWFNESYAI
ncbi:MAG: DNA gyrase inhibitor YacG, partial [Alphaproteobacteria bacterium]|nr:DNA gyrase inhibitor YacG [Alphaproteobacteria bacterium]